MKKIYFKLVVEKGVAYELEWATDMELPKYDEQIHLPGMIARVNEVIHNYVNGYVVIELNGKNKYNADNLISKGWRFSDQ